MKKYKVVATIEARMGATRLPGKVMMPIMGRPMLAIMIERVKLATRVDEIVVATTIKSNDNIIARLAKKSGVGWFRGSEDDVLSRVLGAAKKYQADIIVELTGDCPLIDPLQIDEGIDYFLTHEFDYVANCTSERRVPTGFDIQVFWTKALARSSQQTDDPYDHEHVSLYMWEHPKKFKIGVFGPERKFPPDLRLSVDTDKDLKVVSLIAKGLWRKNPGLSYEDVLDFVSANPQVIEINRMVKQKNPRSG